MANVVAVDFLPRGLMYQLGLFPVLFACFKFFFADEYICGVFIEVDAHAVSGLQEGQTATNGGFG